MHDGRLEEEAYWHNELYLHERHIAISMVVDVAVKEEEEEEIFKEKGFFSFLPLL